MTFRCTRRHARQPSCAAPEPDRRHGLLDDPEDVDAELGGGDELEDAVVASLQAVAAREGAPAARQAVPRVGDVEHHPRLAARVPEHHVRPFLGQVLPRVPRSRKPLQCVTYVSSTSSSNAGR
jgi:hypothetical protein